MARDASCLFHRLFPRIDADHVPCFTLFPLLVQGGVNYFHFPYRERSSLGGVKVHARGIHAGGVRP